MFLVYESARVESRRTDEINHKFEASMGLTGPQTGMIMHLGINYLYVHVGALGAWGFLTNLGSGLLWL